MDSIEEKVRTNLTEEYFRSQRTTFAIQAIQISAISLSCYLYKNDPVYLVAYVCVELLWCVRLWGARQYLLKRHIAGNPENWQLFITASVVLTALAYAAILHLVFDPAEPAITVPYVVMYMGAIMGTGAGAFFAAAKHALTWFYAITLTNLVIPLLLTQDPMYVRLAFVAALVAMSGIWAGHRAHQSRVNSIREKLVNKDLAEALATQVKRAEMAEAIAVRSSREKSRFLSAASHDLRQPLHAVALHLTVTRKSLLKIKENTDISLSPRLEPLSEGFERMSSSVEMLNESLEAMLDMSSLDDRRDLEELRAVELSQIFLHLHKTFFERATEKGLRLQFRNPGVTVLAVPEFLLRTLSNLIDNALKFTLHGGVLVGVRVRPSRGLCIIEVRDSGIGIDAQHHSAVFDEYFQASNEGRDRARGLGLGLSIVRRLVDRQGMTLHLQSAIGRGTKVCITCLMATAEQGSSFSDKRPPQPGVEGDDSLAILANKRIVVVDNEESILQSTRELLTDYGVVVFTARNASEAITLLQNTASFDLAVLDFRLDPDCDGIGLAMQLRDLQPRRILETLIVTGDTEPAEMQRIRKSGMNVLFKPTSGERLLTEIARALTPRSASTETTSTPTPSNAH